jgi:Arc/MetJ-type ribon-helix-helix transcriptional regulator
MLMRTWLGLAVVAALAFPATSAAKSGCPVRDARDMLAAAGQGINGRATALHERYITVVAESRYDRTSIRFGETVRVYGRSLPGVLQGRIGVVLHRDGGRWQADRCDVVPGRRMANALSGRDPCPRPQVRIAAVRVDGLRARLTVRLLGDVTTVRIDSGLTVRRRQVAPGVASFVHDVVYNKPGTYHAEIRAEGGFGPGCGDAGRRASTARRTIIVDSRSSRCIALRNAERYARRMAVQLVTRVPDALADAVDDLVQAGIFSSRSEAVRAGLETVLERERRAATGRAIVEGYRRIPQERDDLAWSDAATSAMIAEEPW